MTYGFCVYHEIDCDYKGSCIDCPHNNAEDTEWFRQDEERAEMEGGEVMNVYCCKAFKGSELMHIKYISAISSQMALIEFRGNIDLDEIEHLYFDVRQVD